MRRFSPDIQLALAPAATYRRMLEEGVAGSWSALVARLVLTIVSIAILAGMGVTGRVTLAIAAGAVPLAIFAVLIQLVPAAVLVASSREHSLSPASALNLLFAGHVPWSLWLIGVMTWAASSGASFSYGATFSLSGVLAAAVPATAWTSVILAAFCRVVLKTTGMAAVVRVAIHQLAILTITLSYIAWAAGGWFQLWI